MALMKGAMPIKKHGRGVEQARRMLDAFANLEVHDFDITETDVDGYKQGFRSGQRVDQLREWMPHLIASGIERQHNVIVRPKGAPINLVQLDDLSRAALQRVRTTAFLILATSPENYQAWVAVQECDTDLARQLRRGSGADPSASGASRIAGSVNFKRKYAPDFPIVEIVEVIPKRTVTQTELKALGLVAAPDLIPARPLARDCRGQRAKQWPTYKRCLQNAPRAHHSDRPDVSRADFTFCLLAIDWGWSVEDTVSRLCALTSWSVVWTLAQHAPLSPRALWVSAAWATGSISVTPVRAGNSYWASRGTRETGDHGRACGPRRSSFQRLSIRLSTTITSRVVARSRRWSGRNAS